MQEQRYVMRMRLTRITAAKSLLEEELAKERPVAVVVAAYKNAGIEDLEMVEEVKTREVSGKGSVPTEGVLTGTGAAPATAAVMCATTTPNVTPQIIMTQKSRTAEPTVVLQSVMTSRILTPVTDVLTSVSETVMTVMPVDVPVTPIRPYDLMVVSVVWWMDA